MFYPTSRDTRLNKSPIDSTGILSRDILLDRRLLSSLERLLSNKRMKIVPWGASPWLYELINHFHSLDLELICSEVPIEANSWTVDYFGSKSGFRKTCLNMGQNIATRIPRGVICSDFAHIIDVAKNYFILGKGVVIKADYGVGGEGTYIVSPSRLRVQNQEELINEIINEIYQWKIYNLGSVVVEEYIEKSPQYPDGSIDVYIAEDGSTKIYDPCQMFVSEDRFFGGVLYGSKILPDTITSIIVQIASKVGEQISRNGYRGWFDVDFVVSKSGQIFLNEFNLRRNSGHCVKGIMDRFQYIYKKPSVYGISEETIVLAQTSHVDFNDILKVFKDVENDNRLIEFIAVPIMISHLLRNPPSIGYVIATHSIKSIYHIKDELYKKLNARFGLLRS